ncbi:LOW QUALITY PROTEIN: hypothetical protein Cgig2_011522 [Carnegiea gigantea]|uniref:Uncharacterized protein n=1 Tax=Carnegiea gigantea TaxID=171969 RepID=A0A9Q1JLI6_9CARY|nr:LOW QUALITY PROTEIN: hypothetical protein Cgig2_011522 [Carnegiea gigantea]
MVQCCSIAANAATTTFIRATTAQLPQGQERPKGGGNYHDKADKTPRNVCIVSLAYTCLLWKMTTFTSVLSTSRKMTSIELGNGLGNKSSMPKSDKQLFVAPGMLARGCGKKLHELYASKSHNTCFVERGANPNVHLGSSTIIGKSPNNLLMRHTSIGANRGASKKKKPSRRIGKTRGRNKGKEIAKLKPEEKLPIEFYPNRVVGENYDIFIRQLGIIVHDTNMCPLRVYRWKVIDDRQLEHMQQAVTNVLSNDDMEVYREHVLGHMHDLADLKRYNITKPQSSLQQALDHVPSGLDKHEWEWLVKEKARAQNSTNRAYYKKDRLHRTGSKPYRPVAWKLGAKTGNEPSFLQIFRETHKKGTEFATPEIAQKYVTEKVLKSKSRTQVLDVRGGVKPKDIRGSYSTRAELEVELNVTRRKNEVLIDRLATVEVKNEKLQNHVESVKTEMMKIMLELNFNFYIIARKLTWVKT